MHYLAELGGKLMLYDKISLCVQLYVLHSSVQVFSCKQHFTYHLSNHRVEYTTVLQHVGTNWRDIF